jgi:DNA-binding SARP family transcriptional activator
MPEHEPQTVRVVLLGGFGVSFGDTPLASVGTPRLQSLLAYVLLHRQTPQSRQQLAFLLWPDSSEAQARTNLRNLIHRLQHTLPHVAQLLDIKPSGLGWRDPARVVLDVADFDAAILAAEQARRRGDLPGVEAHLSDAVALSRGELLPGFYDEWIVAERDRLAAVAQRALDELVDLLEAQREYGPAIVHAERLIKHDPLNEAAYRRLMRLNVLAGDHAGARRVYDMCVTMLRGELGVEPDRATREAYELARRMAGEQQPDARLQVASWPLVGRQSEWRNLRASFRPVSSAQRLLLISGEAGVGKTRLAQELAEWRRALGDLTAAAACYPGGTVSYAPVTTWLRTPRLAAAWAGLADLWLSEVGRIVPELLAERTDLTPRPITEDWQRQRLFEALARALTAEQRPLMLLLEDLQWCDHATVEFLAFLLRWPTPTPVVVCATARVEELDDQPATELLLTALRRERRLQEIELGPLDPAETCLLAAHVIGHSVEVAAGNALYQETEGNALHIVETMRAGGVGPLPAAVQAVIATRLSQLKPRARELAGLAATIGREFTMPLLVCAAGHADEDVVSCLDELVQRRLLREQGASSYDFSHDKIRVVAYAELSAARRRLLHARVADALETLHPNMDTISAILAQHSEAAGKLERAVALYEHAATVARRVYANRDAVAHLRRALVLLDSLPATAASEAWRRRTKSALEESLGDVLDLMGQRAVSIAAYRAARSTSPPDDVVGQARVQRKEGHGHESQQDYPAALALFDGAEAALSSEPTVPNDEWWQEWIEIQIGRARVHYWTANDEAMSSVTTRLGPVVERWGAPTQRASYLQWLVNARQRRERYTPSDETLALSRTALHAAEVAGPSGRDAHARFVLGFVLLWRGELAEAEEHLLAARAAAERAGDTALRIRSIVYLATLNRLARRREAAYALACEALALLRATEILEYVGAAQAHLAWASLRGGDAVAAAEHARVAVEAWRRTASVYPFAWQALWPLVELAVGRADLAEAVRHVSALLDPKQQRLPEPLTDALDAAGLAWQRGTPAAARRHLDVALANARRIGHL